MNGIVCLSMNSFSEVGSLVSFLYGLIILFVVFSQHLRLAE